MGADALGGTAAVSFEDPSVCRNYLCGICPHNLFTNTKMDLGPCPKMHSDKLRDDYQRAVKEGKEFLAIENEYERNISDFVSECDRKIRAQLKRLEKTPEESSATSRILREITDIENKMDEHLQEVEVFGEEGNVDDSLAALEKAEQLKEMKWERERDLQNISETSGGSGHQKLRVCETCSAFLSVLDNDRRLADHFGGKLHLGYVKLREMLQEFRAKKRAKGEGGTGAEPPLSPSSMRNSPATFPGNTSPTDTNANGRGYGRGDYRGTSFRNGSRGGHSDRDRHDRYDDRRGAYSRGARGTSPGYRRSRSPPPRR